MSGVLLNGTSGYLKLNAKVATAFPFTFIAYIASAQANSANTVVNQQQDSAVGNAAFLDFAGGGGVGKRATYYSNTSSKGTTPNLNNTVYQVIVGVFTDVNNCTVYFGSNSGVLTTASGLPSVLASMDSLYIGARNNSGIIQFMDGSVTEVHAYAAALSAGDVQTLVDKSANPETLTGWIDGWTLTSTSDLTSIGGTRTLSLVGGVTNSSLTAPFSRTLAGSFSGSITLTSESLASNFATGASSAFAGAVSLADDSIAASYGPAAGTLVSEPLVTNNGTLLANTTLSYVAVYNDTTGVLVTRRTGITTNASGIFSVADPGIASGTTYRVDWETAGGERRMPRKVAT